MVQFLGSIIQIRTGMVDFCAAAQRHFLTAVERSGHPSGNLFAVVRRGQAPSALGAAVFSAAPGEMLGPVVTEKGYAIVQVLSFTPARLDEPVRNAIKKILFEEWLAEYRKEATIDWYWGNTRQTSQTN